MKTYKKTISVLLVLILTLTLFSCAKTTEKKTPANTAEAEPVTEEAPAQTPDEAEAQEGDTIKKIKEAGVLVVGTSADYPPYEFHTEINGEDTIVGFDISVSKYIADSLGVELKLVDMSFDGLLISLNKGDFDLVMAALTPSEERKQIVDFTDIIFSNDQIVVIRKEDADKYTDIASLNGVKGGFQKGTVQEEIANGVVGEANTVGLTKFYDLITELKTGKLDCVFTNVLVGGAYVSANEDLLVQDVGIVYDVTGFAGAVQKGNTDLAEYVNKCIVEMQDKGLIDQYLEEAVNLAGPDSLE